MPLILALLLLVPQMIARPAFAWFCEGRVCGVTLGRCCCEQNPSQRDAQCGITPRATPVKSRTNPALLCAAGCECSMVLESLSGQTAVHSDVANLTGLFPPLVIFSPAPLISALYFTKPCPSFFIEARGPPVATYLARSLSLRAPPHA